MILNQETMDKNSGHEHTVLRAVNPHCPVLCLFIMTAHTEIECRNRSLSPGRYVGVDTATDEDFDYEERLREIHVELEELTEEAIALACEISKNYEALAP